MTSDRGPVPSGAGASPPVAGACPGQAPAARDAYGRSCAVPGSATAPGAGRSPAESTVALKVGGMQKMLTSVEACPAVSLTAPAGTPVWVIVWAPLSPGPKAPASRCSQSGQAPFPSVQAATVTPPTLQALNVGWSHVPVPAPVQHLKGWGAAPPVVHAALCGQAAAGSPSKQPVFAPVPLALESRQKPQKTLFWPTQVPAPAPVQQLKGCIAAVHCAFAL